MFSMNRRDIPPHLLKYFKPRKVYKPKDDLMIPHRIYDALMGDGWYGRMDICWAKKAPMPESVVDRPTRSHEYVFLLAKSASYYYDAEAIREPNVGTFNDFPSHARIGNGTGRSRYDPNGQAAVPSGHVGVNPAGRNKRSVWTLGPEPYAEAHFATMPTKLVEPCILAGSSAHGCCSKCLAPWERVVEEERSNYISRPDRQTATGGAISGGVGKNFPDTKRTTTGWAATCTCNADVIPCTALDPFAGSGTTLAVALKFGRSAIGIDLNQFYITLAHDRIGRTQPMLLDIT